MAKFYGAIGYAEQVETKPGVWQEKIKERYYSGDILKHAMNRREGENLNSNVTVDNLLSIVSDPFAEQNFQKIRYAVWMGAKWQVRSVEVQRPRLILTIGGVYNE